MVPGPIPAEISRDYEVHEWKHASAILKTDFPTEWADVLAVLKAFRLKKSQVVVGGGGKSRIAQDLDFAFAARGWKEKKWDTKIVVDEHESKSPTHKVDCFKNRVALEIEWSNKDPFFDRDLNNFRLLFDLRVISVGVIITKSDELRETLTELGLWSKYGTTTTWMSKLLPRIEGGGGGGCPLLVFGITKGRYVEDV
ncbi:MAG: hypothetical protein CHACPFDD_01637 [Phycisphaerae bacterium]|nr:hypothetical protein [Phycisphaerae bacterium]